jgi:hypothetical protein
LDPTYTRDPLDPFKVTYEYSASATQSRQTALIATVEEPAPLPAGVLALYSDGKLECAENVGGAATGGECPVSYSKLGEHKVTTIYASGEESATETEVEDIEPISSSTTLSIAYTAVTHGTTDWALAGELTITASTEPSNPSTAPYLSVQYPAEGGAGSNWGSFAPGAAQTFELDLWAYCDEGEVRFKHGGTTNKPMSLSYLRETSMTVKRMASGGYAESSDSAPIPDPCPTP